MTGSGSEIGSSAVTPRSSPRPCSISLTSSSVNRGSSSVSITRSSSGSSSGLTSVSGSSSGRFSKESPISSNTSSRSEASMSSKGVSSMDGSGIIGSSTSSSIGSSYKGSTGGSDEVAGVACCTGAVTGIDAVMTGACAMIFWLCIMALFRRSSISFRLTVSSCIRICKSFSLASSSRFCPSVTASLPAFTADSISLALTSITFRLSKIA